jgi:hypothetical protein
VRNDQTETLHRQTEQQQVMDRLGGHLHFADQPAARSRCYGLRRAVELKPRLEIARKIQQVESYLSEEDEITGIMALEIFWLGAV